MLYLYNSLTRKKEEFKPIISGKIGIYVCGITVYDDSHLGHARSMVCFDVIVRFLRMQGYDVTYVRNITDIDDKIIHRAQERKMDIAELTNTYMMSMYEDTKSLFILPPDSEPRATEHIPSIIQLIEKLIQKGFAYQSATGDICYEVDKFPSYGQLAHMDLEGLNAGARIEVVKEKKSPLDFVLWKRAKEGEPSWPSPWGEGRPGWHIECSAMAIDKLGEHFDIHGGGMDLQFPHHENEIAQSEGATDKTFANYWLHVGMLQINNEKMAKSANNFFTIKKVLEEYHPEVIRYFLLSSHYRSSLNYSKENLKNAEKALTRLYQSLKDITFQEEDPVQAWVEQFTNAMNDDFNTPEALAVLFSLSHEINKTKESSLASSLQWLGKQLGLLQQDPDRFLQSGIALERETINKLIAERLNARQEKNWARADEIRQQLMKQGIELEDNSEGTTWRRR